MTHKIVLDFRIVHEDANHLHPEIIEFFKQNGIVYRMDDIARLFRGNKRTIVEFPDDDVYLLFKMRFL